ncbi:MAG: hypothetical protein KDA72_12255, partial [Planctomycetales bacterium]|nr:hypothetical protein [Planctomycetales bacterium]
EVQQHLAGCETCAREVATFEKISELARVPIEPMRPPLDWDVMAKRLDQTRLCTTLATGSPADTAYANETSARSDGGASGHIHRPADTAYTAETSKPPAKARGGSRHWKITAGGLVALAASLLLFASLRPSPIENQSRKPQVIGSPLANSTVVGEVPMNLQPLLEQFPHDARQALDQLSSQLAASDVPMDQADAAFGRATFVSTAVQSHALPGQAKVAATKVLSFPFCKCPPGQCNCGAGGCNCVACICERPDGSTYLVLEHCQSQAVSFGDLSVRLVNRGDRKIQQVMVDGTHTISFDQEGGTVTVVGLRGDTEIESLFASL